MKYLKYILFLLILIPFNAYAYVGALDEGAFYINNQTTQPFSLTISGNSNTTASFHLVWDFNHALYSNPDLPGSYLFFSVISDKKIDIERSHTFGNFCNSSCFSNDKYLQLVESDGSSYSYVFYFNIVKWARNVGTQVDIFNVDDQFKFINKESGTAHVYIYGAYSNSTNEIPNLINDASTVQQIIIDGQTNAEYIIDNQNQNTEQILESLKACNKKSSVVFPLESGYLTSSGTITTGYQHSDFIMLDRLVVTKEGRGGALSTCFYDKNHTLLSCVANETFNTLGEYNLPTGTRYFRFSYWSANSTPQFDIYTCGEGTQIINDSINDMNDNMTDSSIDSPSGDFGDMEDLIASNGVITNLIALPITLYSNILNGLNQSCSEYNFGQLFGSDIKFQCINLGSLLGTTIWGIIDVLFSGFTIYAIARKMIKVFHNFSGLQEGDVIDD